jgi:hypothetical protein
MPTAYLDTCIISGIAKGDIDPAELVSLLQALKAHRAGTIHIVTSDVAGREIEAIPCEHRLKHELIYNLLGSIPVAPRFRRMGSGMLMGVGGARREDPLSIELRKIIPDAGDVDHLYQGAKNAVPYFLTVDVRTILRHASEIEGVCGVKVRLPTQLLLEPCMNSSGAAV